jgi:hypothetical protein
MKKIKIYKLLIIKLLHNKEKFFLKKLIFFVTKHAFLRQNK